MALLEVKQLTKNFGGLMANDHVDLQVNEGEIVGLIGLIRRLRKKEAA